MGKKVSGVWMDSKNAFIIASSDRTINTDYDIVAKVQCEDHEDKTFKNERVEQSRDDQEQKKYFKEIAAHISGDESIFIFGPGKAQEQFKNFLEDYQNFNSKEIELDASDKLSDSEMKAKVKYHFDA
jgi:stalled ribosome rescue protein Dom34